MSEVVVDVGASVWVALSGSGHYMTGVYVRGILR